MEMKREREKEKLNRRLSNAEQRAREEISLISDILICVKYGKEIRLTVVNISSDDLDVVTMN